MRTERKQIVVAGDVTGDITSSSVDVTNMGSIAIQGIAAGSSPTGTLKVQASLDAGTNWADITSATVSFSAVGSKLILLADVGYPLIRVVYTHTSGTGTLDVWVNGKGF